MFPVITKIGPFTIYSYGFFISLAIIIGFIVANARIKKLKLSTDDLLDLLLYLLIGGIIGAKLLFVLTNNFMYYLHNPIEIFTSGGTGFSFFGIVLAGIPITWWFARKKKINYWALVDILSISVMIGYSIGRIGCFLNGCCYGLPANPDLASFILSMQFKALDYYRYPSQLFVSFGALISFFILRWVDRIKKFYGATFATFLLMYSLVTIVSDFYRDMTRFPPFHLTLSQYLSLILIPVAIGLYIVFSHTQLIRQVEGEIESNIGQVIDNSSFSEVENETYIE